MRKGLRWVLGVVLGAILCAGLTGCDDSKKKQGGDNPGRREGS